MKNNIINNTKIKNTTILPTKTQQVKRSNDIRGKRKKLHANKAIFICIIIFINNNNDNINNIINYKNKIRNNNFQQEQA